jgi:predicted DCC family thiol-disulfide oxidoreductase YuxK
MVFDGDCVVCSAGARFVLRHDRKARHRLAVTQSPLGRALYAHYGLDPDRTNLLVMDGRAHTGSEAVLGVVRNLGPPWSGLWLARLIPRGLREALYRRFARNRYRWFGRRDVCMVPPPGAAERFLS